MENKKLALVGVVGLLFIAGMFAIAFLTLQKNGWVKKAPTPTMSPTNFPVFPSNIIPRVPTATPIPTPTLAPQVTIGPSPDTRPVDVITQTEERNRVEHPDIYLANKMPYNSTDFSMDSSLDASGNITFTVTSTKYGGSELQRKVALWLLSLNLTVDQINSLKIVY